jgi:hypothetical protein
MDAGIIGSGNIGATAALCLEFSAYLGRLGRADERTRTAPPAHYQCAVRVCWTLQGFAYPV